MSLTYNRWDKVEMVITNEGDAIAKNITFKFSEDISVRYLPEIDVKPKSKRIVKFYLKPNTFGEVPLEIVALYTDHLNRKYKLTIPEILDVKGIMRYNS